MKGYNHHNDDAVGICKSCAKGICKECAIDVADGGLACSSACEEKVKELTAIMNKSKGAYKKASGTYFRLATFFALTGGFFIYYGMTQDRAMASLMEPIGTIFLVGMAFMIYTALKYRGK